MVSDPLKTRATARCLIWILESNSRLLQEDQALQTMHGYHFPCVSMKSIKHSKARLSFPMRLYEDHQVLQTMVTIFHVPKKSIKHSKVRLSFPMYLYEEHQELHNHCLQDPFSQTQSHFQRTNPLGSAILWSWIAGWIACIHLHFG